MYYIASKSQVIHHVVDDGFCFLETVRIYLEKYHNIKLSISETNDCGADHTLE